MEIYRSFRIHASRFLPKLPKTHICSSMHGHTFNITIYVKGDIDNQTGFVMDFYDVDNIFNKHVHSIIDHKILNDIEGLENPTSEILATWIWHKLKLHIPLLEKIEVSEDFGTGIIYKK